MKSAQAWKPTALVLLSIMMVASVGCIGAAAQLIYMIKGHKTPAAFKGLEGQRVAVVCVSDASAYGPDTLTYTINKAVSVKLANSVKRITVIPPSEIENWMDRNGWGEHDFAEIGRGLKADKVLAIQVGSYSIREGQTLYKGRADLTISVYDLKKDGQVVFAKGPQEYAFPVNGHPAIQTTDRRFEAAYLGKLTDFVAKLFYDSDALDNVAEDAMSLD